MGSAGSFFRSDLVASLLGGRNHKTWSTLLSARTIFLCCRQFHSKTGRKKIKSESDLSQKLNVWNNGGKKTILFKRGMNLDGLDVILFQRQGAVHLRTVAKTLTVENRKSDRNINTKD